MPKQVKNGKKADKPRSTTSHDKEAVKVLALSVGLREAARQCGINEDTVRQWSSRGQWFAPTALPPTMSPVTTVTTTPSVALASLLAQDRTATKLGASKVARRVFEHLSEAPIPELMRSSRQARDYVDVGAKAQAWEAEAGNTGCLSVDVLTSEGAIRIRTGNQDSL